MATPDGPARLRFTGTAWGLLWRGLLALLAAALVLPAGLGWSMLARWFVCHLRLPGGGAPRFQHGGALLGLALAICLASAFYPREPAAWLGQRLAPRLSAAQVSYLTAAFARPLAWLLHQPEQAVAANITVDPVFSLVALRPMELFPVPAFHLSGGGPRRPVPGASPPAEAPPAARPLTPGRLLLLVALYLALCWLWLEVLRTIIRGLHGPQGGPWRPDLSYLHYVGWNLLRGLSLFSVIGWAWVDALFYRWVLAHTSCPEGRLAFHGSGWAILWRTAAIVLATLLTLGLALPAMLVWYYRWLASQTSLEAV